MANIQLHNDNTIKIEYDGVNHKTSFNCLAVGADGVVTLTESAQLATAIYVDKTSGNDAWAGTYAAPVATINVAIGLCDSTHDTVIIKDNGIYLGALSTITNTFFQQLYKLTGSTATMSLRDNGLVSTDLNTIYVNKTGNDGTGTGAIAAPMLTITAAITKVTAAKTCILINDSETYNETGFTMSGNFKYLYSNEFCSPTVYITATTDNSPISTTILTDTQVAGLYSRPNVVLDNGNKVFFTGAGTPHVISYYVVDYLGTTIKASTSLGFGAGDVIEMDAVCYDSDKIAIIYHTQGDEHIYWRIFNPVTGVDTLATTRWEAKGALGGGGYVTISNIGEDKFFGAYSYTSGGVLKIYVQIKTSANVVFYADTLAYSGGTTYVRLSSDFLTATNEIILVYSNAVSGASTINYKIFALDGSVSKTDAELYASSVVYGLDVTEAFDGQILVSYSANIGGLVYKSDLITRAGVVTSTRTLAQCKHISFSKSHKANVFMETLMLGDPTGFPTDWGIYNLTSKTIYSTITSGITGINFTGAYTEIPYSSFQLYTTGTMVINNCTIDYTGIGLRATGNTTINNSKSFNALYITNAMAKLSNCQIVHTGYADYVLSYPNAVLINGGAVSSGDIAIEHCDLFDNYSGIYLLNSTGNELVKNNIFCKNGTYGIKSTTAITITYGICTDINVNVTSGTGIIVSNPLYVNEGAVNPIYTDLHLKNRNLGYSMTSPAITRSDDNRNAGSYDEKVIGTSTTYTTGTVKKPEIIPITREFSNAVNIKLVDGSYDSYKSNQSEIVELSWKGLVLSEFNIIDAILCSDAKTVRIYFEPTTNPTIFYTFTVLRNNWKSYAAYVPVDEFGKNDISLKVARKYTI